MMRMTLEAAPSAVVRLDADPAGRGWHRLAASSVLTDRRLTQHALGEVHSGTGEPRLILAED
jgi:hypothetical protein